MSDTGTEPEDSTPASEDSPTLRSEIQRLSKQHSPIPDDNFVRDNTGFVVVGLRSGDRVHGVITAVGTDVMLVRLAVKQHDVDLPAGTYQYSEEPMVITIDSVATLLEMPLPGCVPATDEALRRAAAQPEREEDEAQDDQGLSPDGDVIADSDPQEQHEDPATNPASDDPYAEANARQDPYAEQDLDKGSNPGVEIQDEPHSPTAVDGSGAAELDPYSTGAAVTVPPAFEVSSDEPAAENASHDASQTAGATAFRDTSGAASAAASPGAGESAFPSPNVVTDTSGNDDASMAHAGSPSAVTASTATPTAASDATSFTASSDAFEDSSHAANQGAGQVAEDPSTNPDVMVYGVLDLRSAVAPETVVCFQHWEQYAGVGQQIAESDPARFGDAPQYAVIHPSAGRCVVCQQQDAPRPAYRQSNDQPDAHPFAAFENQ